MSPKALIAVLSFAAAAPALAQPYDISWWTVAGGGGTSTGGIYSLSGTIGQSDAGPAMSGGIYTVTGGYWAGSGSGNACPADFDGDGTVDFFDYDAFVVCFEGGTCPPGKTSDFDGDGSSDFFDYDAFVVAFETGCP